MKVAITASRLVIGLDYGTTYTGVSFCEVSETNKQTEQIDIIQNWPSQHSKVGTKDKVPSEITYGNDVVTWGSLIPPQVTRHMWTKLQLEDKHVGQVAKVKREIATSTQENRKQPVEIVGDFLKKVKDHLVKNLDQKYGKALWRSLPVTLIVTVPAVWSDAAKARTLEAVRKGGFNKSEFPQLRDISVATEPECAAIYTIKSLRNTVHDADFAVGDGFTVCDMGGGTVDLISYRVTSLQPIRVEEATVGNGDQCGGSFVDRAFLKLLEKRLGTEDFLKIAGCRSEELPLTSLAIKAARMLQDFSLEAKSGFSGDETNYLRLPPPLSGIEEDAVRNIFDGELQLPPEDMVELFDFPIRRTYELLTEQLREMRKQKKTHVKYIFMVGGFSESPYVFGKVKAFFEAAYDLSVVKPLFAWSAVARGAAAKGIEDDDMSISHRKCRRYYGTDCSRLFVPGKHLEADAFNDQYTGEKRADNQTDWMLRKGQNLATSGTAHSKVELVTHFWPGKTRISTLRLLAADCDRAPRRSVDPEVYIVAVVNVDLNGVPESKFKRFVNSSGQIYLELEYWVDISIQSTIEFSLFVGGQKYGTLTANYE